MSVPIRRRFDLAGTCVFSKQSLLPLFCDLLAQAPLLANLRGHFAEFLNESSLERLGIINPPTCVSLGTVTTSTSERGFSRTRIQELPLTGRPSSEITQTDLPICHPSEEPESNHRIPFHAPSPHGANALWWCRNVDLLPIDYAFQPRLRGRLTLGGITFPRKP